MKVRDGQVVDSFSTLVRPPEGFGEFAPINVSIHGIDERAVFEAPDWPTVFRLLMGFVDGDLLVGHNAAFDKLGAEFQSRLAEALGRGHTEPSPVTHLEAAVRRAR